MSAQVQSASQMLALIPTYEVIIDPGEATRRAFKVSRAGLSDFIEVMVRSGVTDFRVMRQESPNQQIVRH